MTERKLTEKQQVFLEALFSEASQGNIREAMKLAGYSDNTPAREVLNSLSEEITKKAKDFLGEASAEAAWALIQSMRDGSAAGVQNKIKAAESILNRVGVKQSESDVKLNIPESGIVILPAKKVRTADDDTLEEAEVSEDTVS